MSINHSTLHELFKESLKVIEIQIQIIQLGLNHSPQSDNFDVQKTIQ